MDNIKVSICCIAYNHASYIKNALDGFLNQKTDFEFEIIIHDDASIDNTLEIIQEYQKKNPNKIRLISQLENQYSKGVRIFPTYIYPIVKGEYVALCEGDDYWTDELKLQKQVDYMERNKKCTLTFHNATIMNQVNGSERLFLSDDNEEREYSTNEMIIKGFIPTASIMFRSSSIKYFPQWLYSSIVGDYPLIIINSSLGYAYYFNEVMSVYRTNVPGSATNRFNEKSKSDQIKYLNGFLDILNNFDVFTKGKYAADIETAKIPWEFNINLLKRDKLALNESKFKYYLQQQTLKFKLVYYIKLHLPFVLKLKNKFLDTSN